MVQCVKRRIILINKEKFVEYINFIKSLDDKESKLQDGLQACFGKENVGCIFVFDEVVPKMIEMLCDLMEVEYSRDPYIGDDIQYFIYELNFGKSKDAVKAITVDGKTYDLSTAEKLYDYILDSNKEKNIK